MPDPAYFTSIKVYGLFDGLIYDEIVDVLQGSLKGKWGIQSNSVLERMGGIERLEFDVRNDSGAAFGEGWATPGGPSMKEGWGTGLRVLAAFSYDGWTKYFTAVIPRAGIRIDPNTFGSRSVHVMAVGWTNEFSQHKLHLIEPMLEVRLDEVATAILADMSVQPQAVDIRTGTKLFPLAFDTLRLNDRAMGELAKAVFSEFSYAYTKRDRTVGETFVVENHDSRGLLVGPENIPILAADSGYLLTQDSDYLNTQANDRIIANQVQSSVFNNNMQLTSPNVAHGDELINYANFIVYPRTYQSAVDLFTLESRVLLEAGATITVRGTYSNPNSGEASVAAQVDTLVSTATLNSREDGLGTDLSGDLVFSATHGASEAEFTLQNTGVTDGYYDISTMGDAIFIYYPLEIVSQNTASIAAYGLSEVEVPMKYIADPLAAQIEADLLILNEKDPRTKARSWDFLANQSSFLMLAFLFLDVGKAAFFQHDLSYVAATHFINGVEFWTKPGNILYYRFTTAEAVANELTYFAFDTDPLDGTVPLMAI